MEHLKFKERVAEMVDQLTWAQGEKLIDAIHKRGDLDEVCKAIDRRLIDDPSCPHCDKKHLHRHGKAHGLQRYKCADCFKTFNALTGTPLARLRKKERWLIYAQELNSGHSIRKAADNTKVHKNTSFRWRHRFLKALNTSKIQSLTGIVEMDEFFMLESRKGKKNLPRPARKRGGSAKKKGLSCELIPVLIARDSAAQIIDAVLPNRSKKAVSAVLKGVICPARALICMDGDPAFIAFAKKQRIEYELIIASRGEYVHEGVLHIQNINGYIRRFRQWIDRFNGVATKYLASYLGWRRWLEQTGSKITPHRTLQAAFS